MGKIRLNYTCITMHWHMWMICISLETVNSIILCDFLKYPWYYFIPHFFLRWSFFCLICLSPYLIFFSFQSIFNLLFLLSYFPTLYVTTDSLFAFLISALLQNMYSHLKIRSYRTCDFCLLGTGEQYFSTSIYFWAKFMILFLFTGG